MPANKKLHGPKAADGSTPGKGGFHGFHKDSLPDPLLGTTLDGGYAIRRRIGSGGTSSVYAAERPAPAEGVAVKIASPRLALETMNKLIENEAAVLGRLAHDNIIRALAGGEHGGRRYIVLEYLEGQTLFEAVDLGRRMSWNRARATLLSVCDALEAVHGLGLVHGDVKPGNIFLQQAQDGERVKLLDFGMARDPEKPQLVPENVAAGTATYMAPEVILREKNDQRADVYALGVVMYKMLCGIAPFTGSTRDVLLLHISAEPESPREVHPFLQIPLDIEDVVLRALEKDPERRFQTVREMRQALEACSFWPKEIGLIDGMDWSRILKLSEDSSLF